MSLTSRCKGSKEIINFGLHFSHEFTLGNIFSVQNELSLDWDLKGCVIMRELYSMSCIGVLPFIEDLSETVQSGLVASSRDSEEHA